MPFVTASIQEEPPDCMYNIGTENLEDAAMVFEENEAITMLNQDTNMDDSALMGSETPDQ